MILNMEMFPVLASSFYPPGLYKTQTQTTSLLKVAVFTEECCDGDGMCDEASKDNISVGLEHICLRTSYFCRTSVADPGFL